VTVAAVAFLDDAKVADWRQGAITAIQRAGIMRAREAAFSTRRATPDLLDIGT